MAACLRCTVQLHGTGNGTCGSAGCHRSRLASHRSSATGKPACAIDAAYAQCAGGEVGCAGLKLLLHLGAGFTVEWSGVK